MVGSAFVVFGSICTASANLIFTFTDRPDLGANVVVVSASGSYNTDGATNAFPAGGNNSKDFLLPMPPGDDGSDPYDWNANAAAVGDFLLRSEAILGLTNISGSGITLNATPAGGGGATVVSTYDFIKLTDGGALDDALFSSNSNHKFDALPSGSTLAISGSAQFTLTDTFANTFKKGTYDLALGSGGTLQVKVVPEPSSALMSILFLMILVFPRKRGRE